MTEVAFKLKHGSEMEKKYFSAEKARMEFEKRVLDFLDRHSLGADKVVGFGHYDRLTLRLTEEGLEELRPQLLKNPLDGDMVYQFRSQSALQKAYKHEVLKDDLLNRSCKNKLWYFPFIQMGSYAMWDDGTTVYGYLQDKVQSNFKLSDDMEPIPLSEYYKVQEELEAKEG